MLNCKIMNLQNCSTFSFDLSSLYFATRIDDTLNLFSLANIAKHTSVLTRTDLFHRLVFLIMLLYGARPNDARVCKDLSQSNERPRAAAPPQSRLSHRWLKSFKYVEPPPPPTPLVRLPSELLQQIVSYLPLSSVVCVHYTSREPSLEVTLNAEDFLQICLQKSESA